MGLKEEKKYKYLFRGAFVKAKAKIPDKWQEYKIVVADPAQRRSRNLLHPWPIHNFKILPSLKGSRSL